jgi:phenylpropionate dioxygenase-like ring-hydroxylating dioxygenase large terminal subunit
MESVDWSVVLRSEQLPAHRPVAVQLWGKWYVLFRDAEGRPHALNDRCIHRGAALSRGHLRDGCIVCPYHGWAFNGTGACVEMPSSPQHIPKGVRSPEYPVIEQRGVIWLLPATDSAAIGVPPPPRIAGLEVGDTWIHFGQSQIFNHSWSWTIENATDFGHVRWVHNGVIGWHRSPIMPKGEINRHLGDDRRPIVGLETIVSERAVPMPRWAIRAVPFLETFADPVRFRITATYTWPTSVDILFAYGSEFQFMFFLTIFVVPEEPERTRMEAITTRNYVRTRAFDWLMRVYAQRVLRQDARIADMCRSRAGQADIPELSAPSDVLGLAIREVFRRHGPGFGFDRSDFPLQEAGTA